MPTISKAIIDSNIRTSVFNTLRLPEIPGFHKINDRQYGVLVRDDNGVERYVRIGAIVAEIKEDMTAAEYMTSEIAKYEETQRKKAERATARAEKATKDKKKREQAQTDETEQTE